MTEYKVEGDTVYRRDYSFGKWEFHSVGGDALQEKADLEGSEAIYAAASRDAWQRLLRQTFPTAKLCNCGDALYGCKYGCDWARSRTKEAVATKLLGASPQEEPAPP